MINPYTNWELSAETGYLANQMPIVMSQIDLAKTKTMLFLGSGDGQALNDFARANPDWQIEGVDFNPKYIEKARSNAPGNIKYHCCKFSEFQGGTYGAIVSPGLLSWIEPKEFDGVMNILANNSELGSMASFGFDNAFYWSELAPIRKAFIELCAELEDIHHALAVLRSVTSGRQYSSIEKARHALELTTDPIQLRHWLLQPSWRDFYPDDVSFEFARKGFNRIGLKELEVITHLGSNVPYLHWNFVRTR